MWSTEQSGRRPLVALGRLLLCTERGSVQPAPVPKGRASELWPPWFLVTWWNQEGADPMELDQQIPTMKAVGDLRLN